MSKPKFTPGPWRWRNLGVEDLQVITDIDTKAIQYVVANLPIMGKDRTEQIANAQLVAESPVMHKLLCEVYSLLDYESDGNDELKKEIGDCLERISLLT